MEYTQSGVEMFCVYNCMMTRRGCVCVFVQIVTDLSCTVFPDAGDRLALKCLRVLNCISMQKFIMVCESSCCVVVQVVTVYLYMISYGAVYRMASIGYPTRQAGENNSSYVELYEYVNLYDENARAFTVDLIIRIHINAIQ